MKKLKLVVLGLVTSLTSFGQVVTTDSVYVMKETDSMSDKTYYSPNRCFIVKNETGKIGFKVSLYINKDMEPSMITATMVGIGSCNENDEIIILLENGSKITKKSWKKFNCEGETYFDLDRNDIESLKSSPISKIRMTNGRSYDSYTGDVKLKDKRYFIQLFYALGNKLVVEGKMWLNTLSRDNIKDGINPKIIISCFLKSDTTKKSENILFIDVYRNVPNTLKIISPITNNYYKVIVNGKNGYLHSNYILINN